MNDQEIKDRIDSAIVFWYLLQYYQWIEDIEREDQGGTVFIDIYHSYPISIKNEVVDFLKSRLPIGMRIDIGFKRVEPGFRSEFGLKNHLEQEQKKRNNTCRY